MRFFFLLFFFLISLIASIEAQAQCASPIIANPPLYEQTFDGAANNWVASGSNSSWQRGAPSKARINSTGQGTDCWITGTLTGNSYPATERSYLTSPCINISAFQRPQVSFLIFVETETSYDGACFQYSFDNLNWTTLGTVNSNSNCLGTNWFNLAVVRNLESGITPRDGWSGNSVPGGCDPNGGNTAGVWVQATHSLMSIKGSSSVFFRFHFGAGSTCNSFNGFAADRFRIEELPANGPDVDFIYNCLNSTSYSFSSTVQPCQQSIEWDFGDGYTATGTNTPTHNYSVAGDYDVTMRISYLNGQVSVKTRQVKLAAADISLVSPVSCPTASDGALQVTVNNAGTTGSFFYDWYVSGQSAVIATTPSISNLAAGTYVVRITSTAPGFCTLLDTFTLTPANPFLITPIVTNAICRSSSGQILLNVSGGSPPYDYLWDDGSTASSRTGLTKGSYSVQVTDSKGCSESLTGILVDSVSPKLNLNLGEDTVICSRESLLLKAGLFDEYLWQDGSSLDTFRVNETGLYYVQVKDNRGCEATDSIVVTVDDCKSLFFPNSFTPNKDGLNDGFGPLGNFDLVSRYFMKVFNRYGQLVFSSQDPTVKWDGKVSGADAEPGVYVWSASFYYNGKFNGFKKGSILLLR
jgi:gliding motility-associated-like protein